MRLAVSVVAKMLTINSQLAIPECLEYTPFYYFTTSSAICS